MEETVRFGVSLPAQLIHAFDDSIAAKGYKTRSEAIRDLMREHLVEEEWASVGGEVIATVTIVYDHHTRELSHVLDNLQHDHHESIVCTTHVHVDAHNCLEVIVVRGTSEAVRAIADQLISVRGVRHGKATCTTTGAGLA
jgi:CopG family transcriptional regulator, nickel-responsive regulator